MAISSIHITATPESAPSLEVLSDLVRRRSAALQEDASKSAIATAINILSSLKALTKKAPEKGRREMYTLQMTGFHASWLKRGGYRRVVRTGPRGSIDWNVTNMCRDLVGNRYNASDDVKVWKIQLKNEELNRTVYYCYSQSEDKARDYVENVILSKILRARAGMAKYAIGIAQAKASDRPMVDYGPHGRPFRIAYNAAKFIVPYKRQKGRFLEGFSEGRFMVHFIDELRYSMNALKGGRAAFATAIKRAANKTAGLIHLAYVNKKFKWDIPTPFPEVGRRA